MQCIRSSPCFAVPTIPRSRRTQSHLVKITCSMGGKPAGRLLRDAMNQPKQGSNLQLLAASNYLRSLGIDDETTVRRCIDVLTNPNSLFGGTRAGKKPVNPFARKITVEEMEEVVAFFMNNGFAQLEVARIVKEFPQVLGYPVEARLQPLFAYLAEALQLSPAAVADLLKARPVLLGLQRESVERMVGFLIENGSSQEEILKLLETSL